MWQSCMLTNKPMQRCQINATRTLCSLQYITVNDRAYSKRCATTIRPISHLRQSRKCDRACRTLRHGASHSRATRFRNRALFCCMRLWRASESRVKDARQNRRCDFGLRNIATFVHSLRHSKIRVFVKMRGLVKFVTISCAFRKCRPIWNLLFTCKHFRRTTRVSCVSYVCLLLNDL